MRCLHAAFYRLDLWEWHATSVRPISMVLNATKVSNGFTGLRWKFKLRAVFFISGLGNLVEAKERHMVKR